MRNIKWLVSEINRQLDPVSSLFISRMNMIYAIESSLYDSSGHGSLIIHYKKGSDRYIANMTVFPSSYVLATTDPNTLRGVKKYGLRGKTDGVKLMSLFYYMGDNYGKVRYKPINR